MAELMDDLREQPQALRALARYYQNDGADLMRRAGNNGGGPGLLVFSGMGASYHAALVAAAHAGACGLPALAVEAVDLLNYQAEGMLRIGHTLVYISQSGGSVEVTALLERNAGRARVIAVTNRPDSPLGRSAALALPILADQRFRLASKNYVNSLAVLWLLVRRLSAQPDGDGMDLLEAAAQRAAGILARAEETQAALVDALGVEGPLFFLGHGPHAATARQCALMLSEWARMPVLHAGVGAFRHGFVETVTPETRVVFFTPPGRTEASALALANALPALGPQWLRVACGEIAPRPPAPLDEFLSPLLDVLPMQLYTDAAARLRGITPDFRFIDATRTL